MRIKETYHKAIATGFGMGFSPIAPGTVGALLATILWWGGYLLIGGGVLLFALTVAVTLLFTLLGVASTTYVQKEWGKDPSRVVVDEMVGVWIPLLAVSWSNTPYYWMYMLLALLLFRLFDIFKPCGIRHLESIEGAWGVMLDDILAGVYSLIIITALMSIRV